MVSTHDFAYLRIAHGCFNLTIVLFFIFQAWLGLQIRKKRSAKKELPFTIIRRHRKFGPVLVPSGVLGFLSGWILIYFDAGHLFKYPLHSITGLVIALLILVTYAVSRSIRAGESLWRERHYRLGLLIMCLYGIQAFLGIGILL
jgi:uncharacterized membrane protein YozB (DUF420 family)